MLQELKQPSRHVTDKHRLELCDAATDQRQDGTAPDHGGESAEEVELARGQ
jgi:hypothetical protein